jgi:glycosyltransferase involved in cell wall biosynthesis
MDAKVVGSNSMKILLVGNYTPDRQHSMQRFAAMLHEGLRAAGHEVRLLTPRPILNWKARNDDEHSPRFRTAGKWIAYADKFVAFPASLRRAVQAADVVHICDHSNAMYVAHMEGKPHVVTCHDLLAVRGALGESTDCPATATGRVLQRWILKSLRRAQMVACVSRATRGDLLRLAGKQMEKRSCVVPLGVASTMRPLAQKEAQERLNKVLGRSGRPFLLNVGSSLARKNRDGTLRIFKRISQQMDCDLVFAGEPLSAELKRLKTEIGLNGNVIEVPQPDDGTLEALYSGAFALLYPTKFEGFGWPALEAQQCGCPVISSDSTSLPEVVGEGGFLRDPEDEEGFALDTLKLADAGVREQLVERGFENVKRFTPERMVNSYIEIYRGLCAQNGN